MLMCKWQSVCNLPQFCKNARNAFVCEGELNQDGGTQTSKDSPSVSEGDVRIKYKRRWQKPTEISRTHEIKQQVRDSSLASGRKCKCGNDYLHLYFNSYQLGVSSDAVYAVTTKNQVRW